MPPPLPRCLKTFRAHARRRKIRSEPDMPIDRSGPTSSLIAALRADITRRSERNQRQANGDAGDSQEDAAGLKRELADLVRMMPADDPQGLQRRVIETVLRWEFGG